MIALAILGIVVVLAVSNFQGMMEKYRVEGETKQMFADLMDARGQGDAAEPRLLRADQRRTITRRTRTRTRAPDGNGTWESTDALAAGRDRAAHDHHRSRRAFKFPLQPERDRLRDGNHPALLDRAAGLRLHHRPATRIKMGQINAGHLCRKIAIGE